jgi:hypothetical protein
MNPTQPVTDEIDPIFNSLTRYNQQDPRARRGINYGAGPNAAHVGQPMGDDSHVNQIASDRDDFVNFKKANIPDRDSAQRSEVDLDNGDNTTGKE